jgi:16S rRNA (guanine527-N7)-methyltransferase
VSLTPQAFADLPDVSRETFDDFSAYEALLAKWNRKINLVSPKAARDFWGRHALDSWQLVRYLPDRADTLIDLGSGAGFPAIPLAIHFKQRGQGHVTLVESAGKKANFLRAVIRELSLPASVWAGRAEDMPPRPFDVITARAFAPLPRLLTYAQPFWQNSSLALLLKGQGAGGELTQASERWIYDVESEPSLSDPTGVILKITGLAPKPEKGPQP